MIIEGLKFNVTGRELQDFLTSRAQHHRTRQQQYEAQVAMLPKEDNVEEFAKNTSNSLQEGLEEKAKSHQAKAELFEWRAAHVSVPDTYQLSEHDLQTIEIVTRGRF